MNNWVYLLGSLFGIHFMLSYFKPFFYFHPSKEITITPDKFNLQFEDIYLQNDQKINGWLIKTKNKTNTVILHCHGNAGNISNRIPISKTFVNLGYDVFVFDYRGFGNSTGKPNELGMYKDAETTWNYLNDKYDNIIIYGESIGCAMASHLAKDKKSNKLILQSGFTSMKQIVNDILDDILGYNILLPYVNLYCWNELDTIEYCKKYDGKLMIIHSESDEVIPYSHGIELGKIADVFYTCRGEHNDMIFDSDLIKAIDRFIKK